MKRTSEGCFAQLQANDDPEEAEATIFLGAPFLTRYVTVYDRVFLRMGLGFAVHASAIGWFEYLSHVDGLCKALLPLAIP